MSARFDLTQLPQSPDLSRESSLWEKGIKRVAGIDEVGRGAVAGPVAAAVIVLPPGNDLVSALEGVDDSKKMTPASRQHWAIKLKECALDYAVGFCTNTEIDEVGIISSTKLAVKRALDKMSMTPQHLLIDYIELEDCAIPQTSLVKGDLRSLSIAGASILAKTERDALMVKLAQEFPDYGFDRNKGYATRAHREALAELGPCPIHRLSFKVKGLEAETHE